MKKLLLFFYFSVALSFSSKAQTSVYHPFPDSDAVWCSSYTNYGCLEDSMSLCSDGHDTYMLDGFTQINSKTYTKVLNTGYGRSNGCHGMACANLGTPQIYNSFFYIRQDSIAKKVFIYDTIAQVDTIFYDFNLQLGDSLNRAKVYWGTTTSNDWAVIVSIDSILIKGQYRKKYNFIKECGIDTSSLIEGIGSTTGLIYRPADCLEDAYYPTLNEYIEDNHVWIGDSTRIVYDCLLPTVIESTKINILSIVSPNPFHTTATLTISDNSGIASFLAMTIYDVMGRVVQQQIVNRNSEIVNRNGLPDGLYFYQLRTKDYELIATGKFVVE